MDEIKEYSIFYTQTAEEDIFSKAEYMETVYRDRCLAYTWYTRLKTQIQKDLSSMPYKFQPYQEGEWAGKGVREYILRNDIVLYSIDETSASVIIHDVYTKGKNMAECTPDEESVVSE